jgi:hypothetical protein
MAKIKFSNRSREEQERYFKNSKLVRERQDGQITNREFAKGEHFQLKCMEAKVEPTKRQASKYRRGLGKAAN